MNVVINGLGSRVGKPVSVEICFAFWLQYFLDGFLSGVTEEPRICSVGKNMFGPSFHQRTVSVGFSVCGFG